MTFKETTITPNAGKQGLNGQISIAPHLYGNKVGSITPWRQMYFTCQLLWIPQSQPAASFEAPLSGLATLRLSDASSYSVPEDDLHILHLHR
ncbi:hypothetical protein [Ralstonia soli]|uniref:Uncharacterized protein n=1 Tax=Ralstonia soli TaxID=2953896 RepID=A0ABT1AEA3_9RALS|nr:hypothetical protein [Ralstonia soli]MCO5396649.1 hypothetical protein [Ralstonia soli]